MAKYLVETYYNCSFKVTHYLDEVNEKELSALDKRDDGKFEIIEVKLDNRKTKSLENKEINNRKINNDTVNLSNDKLKKQVSPKEENLNFIKKIHDGVSKRFSMPDRRKGYIQKATIGDHKVYR